MENIIEDIVTTNGSICYLPGRYNTNGGWQGDNPLDIALPGFIRNVCVIVSLTRLVVFLLKPLRQPRVIAEILVGFLLSRHGFGRFVWFYEIVFKVKAIEVLETVSNIGLIYSVFLVGLEMDVNMIKRTSRKAFVIAVSSIVVPFGIGASITAAMMNAQASHSFPIFMGVGVSVTTFRVLVRLLAELKLLNTEVGRLAMSSALVSDMCAWSLFAIATSIVKDGDDHKGGTSLLVLFQLTVFVLVCLFVVRPAMSCVVRRAPEGKKFSDFFLCLVLTGVLLCAFLSKFLQSEAIVGAFVYGLVIPNGPLAAQLIEKLEDFVNGLLLPLYFAVGGLDTSYDFLGNSHLWVVWMGVSLLAYAAKVGVTLLLGLYYEMPFREGLTLGLLVNTKGLIEYIMLFVGKDRKALDDEAFGTLVLVGLATTCIIAPTVRAFYRPSGRFGPYRRTILKLKPESELRILACIHTPRHVSTIINFLEASHPTKKSPFYVYALHLVELTGRASAMLTVHNSQGASGDRTQSKSDHIINAFENYLQHAAGVSVQTLTAVSAYPTMHEDICNVADDKRVTFIILPFHKQQTVDGGMESLNPAHRTINQNVLANAPCSVGILVDRGLTSSFERTTASDISHHVVVLFFGGPDDREALSYAWRMAQFSDVRLRLTVVRFVPGEDATESMVSQNESSTDRKVLTVVTDNDKERQKDDNYIKKFRLKTGRNESVVYTESLVNNAEETLKAIRAIDSHHDLYVVGRGQGVPQLTAGLTEWCEFPELGAIGDLLASSDFGETVSVLAVQQFAGLGTHDELATPDSLSTHSNLYSNFYDTGASPPRNDRGRSTEYACAS